LTSAPQSITPELAARILPIIETLDQGVKIRCRTVNSQPNKLESADAPPLVKNLVIRRDADSQGQDKRILVQLHCSPTTLLVLLGLEVFSSRWPGHTLATGTLSLEGFWKQSRTSLRIRTR
ncbi:MAG: hypothetical protein Q9218_002848, partial [Villophora microphyllina]